MKAMVAKDTTIIQVGDFGVGFRSRARMDEEMVEINTRLAKNNNNLLVIRGNHDDPAYFDGNYNFSNIEFLPDYTVRTIEGRNYLGSEINEDYFDLCNKRISEFNPLDYEELES